MHENDAPRIVIDDSIVMFRIVVPLTDNYRGIIYNCDMFIEQATGDKSSCYFQHQEQIS